MCATVVGIEFKGRGEVFNFTVECNHNYFVGSLGLLTHNAFSPVGGGRSFSREPLTLQDQMTLDAARNGAGTRIIENLGDARFKGMENWQYAVRSSNNRGHNRALRSKPCDWRTHGPQVHQAQ
ncbi:MAG: hypothetical protein IPJ30_23865 [Acidobacteria bacterium]|nr:hypothetical protein [Acidobacteriota bacterium]